MPKNTMLSRVLDDIAAPSNNGEQSAGLYDFLDAPPVSSVAINSQDAARQYDVEQTALNDHDVWPHDMSEEKRANAIRVIFRRVNVHQATASFRHITLLYLEHVLHMHSAVVMKYPYTRKYLYANPLGRDTYPFNDPRIYLQHS